MKKLLLVALLAVAALMLPSCKVSSGAYAATDGIVLCQATAIDVDQKPYPLAHAINVGRYASCNGEEYVAPLLSVTTYLFHVEAFLPGGGTVNRLCHSTGPVTLASTSGLKVSTSDTWDCPGGAPGEYFFARSLVRGRIGAHAEVTSWQDSPVEQWTLPLGAASPPPELLAAA